MAPVVQVTWSVGDIASDIALLILLVCLTGVMIDAIRVARRVGWRTQVGRFAIFTIILSSFFYWFSLVYLDRRFDVWPQTDLNQAMGFRWYWLPRLVLSVGVVQFWRGLRRP